MHILLLDSEGPSARGDARPGAQADTVEESTERFAHSPTLADSLRAITSHAVDMLVPVDCADILVVDGRRHLRPRASTGSAAELTAAQALHQQGPCLDALERPLVRSDDLASESRWPAFSAAAVSMGFRGVLSLQLRDGGDVLGSLNLYLRDAGDTSAVDMSIARLLADHAAETAESASRVENIRAALVSRDLIGQAKGIIMERFGVDSRRAFNMLSQLSQHKNVRVSQLAEKLVNQESRSRWI